MSQVYAVAGDSASSNSTMMDYLHAKWIEHLGEDYYGAARNFVPCLAHILHNCVIAFLNALKAEPADNVDMFD